MLFKVPRLYDSHTHFHATGEIFSGLRLHDLTSPLDIKNIDQKNPAFYRKDWLVGFGWNDAQWELSPHKSYLDEIFPSVPVLLAKSDGHSCWVNSLALKHLGIQSKNGILTEVDHLKAWDALPQSTYEQTKKQILFACGLYNRAGFTHIRDMSCTENLWNHLIELSDRRELTLAIEENFTIYNLNNLEEALAFCKRAKASETRFVRMKGIKIFYDGSLGSETAYLSKPYSGIEGGNCGRVLWQINELEEVFRKTWTFGLEVSVHCIGDQASHEVIGAARKVSASGVGGKINLEHAQVLRPETIQMMKPLHIRCHMQPCHWLSDRVWLKDKLQSLYDYVFPWESLRAAKIPISFGCDSPVEPPSFLRNLEALKESPKFKIKKLEGDISEFHSHPDRNFVDSYSEFADEKLQKVIFDGAEVFSQ